MSSDSMLVFEEASATQMAQAFRERVSVVQELIPDVAADIKAAVGDWTGESRKACDAALKRMEERGEELAELLTAAAEAMDKILAEGQHAESKAFACIDS
ncbi:MAG: 1-deoxy-D-xylulose-5-phosphate synthase [Schaalia odontolytica]